MKWRSRITGATYSIADCFRDDTIKVAIFKENENWDTPSRPIATLSYRDLLDNFEKVE
jgi:hypothetical protein